jgi:hypothetical protein
MYFWNSRPPYACIGLHACSGKIRENLADLEPLHSHEVKVQAALSVPWLSVESTLQHAHRNHSTVARILLGFKHLGNSVQ